MTTIVWRNGVLASDSRSTYGGDTINLGNLKKIHRLKSGGLAAGCGTTAAITRIIAAIDTKAEYVPKAQGTIVVEVKPGGLISVHEADGTFTVPQTGFYAWGSGMAAALGALHAGASAAEAVAAACKVDPLSGGAVQAVRLKPDRSRPANPRKRPRAK